MEYYLNNFTVDIDRCINTKSEYDYAILVHKCFKKNIIMKIMNGL